MQLVTSYRLDRQGRAFALHVDGTERRLSTEETRDLIVRRPEVVLCLDNKG